MSTDRAAIEELIYSSCMALDENDYDAYMGLCGPDFTYRLTAFSPEVRQNMHWLDHDRAEMEELFKTLPKHNSDKSPLTRNAVVYQVKVDPKQKKANVVTALQIYKTALNGGKSELFAVGKYLDEVDLGGDSPRLASRQVKLDTRDLGWGYHVPF